MGSSTDFQMEASGNDKLPERQGEKRARGVFCERPEMPTLWGVSQEPESVEREKREGDSDSV